MTANNQHPAPLPLLPSNLLRCFYKPLISFSAQRLKEETQYRHFRQKVSSSKNDYLSTVRGNLLTFFANKTVLKSVDLCVWSVNHAFFKGQQMQKSINFMELHGHTGAVFSQIVNSNTDILMKKMSQLQIICRSLFIYEVTSVFQTGLFPSNKFT